MTIPKDLWLDGPLWQFAGRIWSRPTAQRTALELQQLGWNVTDILCALWLATQDRSFRGLDSEQVDGVQVSVWRSQVTEALRKARKAIIKDNPATDHTRDCIAHSELEAEKVELALAYRVLMNGNFSFDVAPNEGVTLTADTVKHLALENLQATAPEKAMDTEAGILLETLTEELQTLTAGDHRLC